jgi:DNA repair photolyase
MAIISESKLWKKRLGDWVINPYVGCEHGCKHCYCPAMPGVKFTNGGRSQREWGQYIFPKEDLLIRLKKELKTFKPQRNETEWGKGVILLSFLTDCYSPIESKLQLTREILKLVLEAGHKVRIQTRSALVERDFDILEHYPKQVILGTSLPYLDDKLARILEPGATAPTRRVKMLERAVNKNISIYVAIAPVMPFHDLGIVEEVLQTVSPLDPVEVFSEVLNPMDDNVKMMNEVLQKAGRKERISEFYRANQWVRWTYEYLYHAFLLGKKLDCNFICWPSPHSVKNPLSEKEQRWLLKWLPSESMGLVGA